MFIQLYYTKNDSIIPIGSCDNLITRQNYTELLSTYFPVDS